MSTTNIRVLNKRADNNVLVSQLMHGGMASYISMLEFGDYTEFDLFKDRVALVANTPFANLMSVARYNTLVAAVNTANTSAPIGKVETTSIANLSARLPFMPRHMALDSVPTVKVFTGTVPATPYKVVVGDRFYGATPSTNVTVTTPGVQATGTLTVANNTLTSADTFTIGATTLAAVTNFAVGGTSTITATNIAAAITAHGTLGPLVTAVASTNTVLITQKAVGAGLVFTAGANITASGAGTLAGGVAAGPLTPALVTFGGAVTFSAGDTTKPYNIQATVDRQSVYAIKRSGVIAAYFTTAKFYSDLVTP